MTIKIGLPRAWGWHHHFLAATTALAVVSLPIAAYSVHTGRTIEGKARIIDGDTIEIGGTHVRLQGIDAPERNQECRDASGTEYRCGQTAASALVDLAHGQMITCEALGKDRHGRTLAVCKNGNGTDRAGSAILNRRISGVSA